MSAINSAMYDPTTVVTTVQTVVTSTVDSQVRENVYRKLFLSWDLKYFNYNSYESLLGECADS